MVTAAAQVAAVAGVQFLAQELPHAMGEAKEKKVQEMCYHLLPFRLSARHVFFMNSCNLEVRDMRLESIVLCVSSCPEEQLNTLEEVQLFANTSGGYRGPGTPAGHLCSPGWANVP